jgi:Xaa-Pro aminopeptidase
VHLPLATSAILFPHDRFLPPQFPEILRRHVRRGSHFYFTHRLGHGIGLDGHEHPYLVRGSKTVLEPGMTFSNEPGIYIPGEFGLRCEDVMAIAPDGPAQLLTPGFQVSLEKPLG